MGSEMCIRDSTLPGALNRIGQAAALAHCDIGSGDRKMTAQLAKFVGSALVPHLAPGAIICTDQAFSAPEFQTVNLPREVALGRYHLYRNKLI